MISFPSIGQFRQTIKSVIHRSTYVGKNEAGEAVYDHSKDAPRLNFLGTPKIHGRNSGIIYCPASGEITFQSRERELSLESDNAGFMLFMSGKLDVLSGIFRDILDVVHLLGQLSRMGGENPSTRGLEKIVMFGEWCGGSIQKGVAISGLPKMFVVFAVRLIYSGDIKVWFNLPTLGFLPSHNNDQIFSILQFGSYAMEIDFAHPELAQNKLVELTQGVEKECPVGKFFGKLGVGEGVVWRCVDKGWEDSDFWFKVKGEEHSVSKVKTLAPVDVEQVNNINSFVVMAVTENRLVQMLGVLVNEKLKPFEMSSLGDFIRLVYSDVIKEESDTIVGSQLDPKKLGGPIAGVCRKWFIGRLNSRAVA